MRIGVIGTGNIGGMLARAFATNSTHDVHIYNRTKDKAESVREGFPNIYLSDSAERLVQTCETLFICTKADDGRRLLTELGPLFTPNQTLVSTISTIPLADIGLDTRACVAKVIPSIVQTVRSGVLLVTFHPDVSAGRRESLFTLLKDIGVPFQVQEEQIRVCSDLTSCGPAFLSFLLLQWAESAERTGRLHRAEAEHLLTETLIGMCNLLRQGMTFRDILQRVAVPGGVTERGLDSLERDAPALFDNLHETTAGHIHGGSFANVSTR